MRLKPFVLQACRGGLLDRQPISRPQEILALKIKAVF